MSTPWNILRERLEDKFTNTDPSFDIPPLQSLGGRTEVYTPLSQQMNVVGSFADLLLNTVYSAPRLRLICEEMTELDSRLSVI